MNRKNHKKHIINSYSKKLYGGYKYEESNMHFLFAYAFMMQSVVVFAEGNSDLGLNAKSAILMEETTGNILYESNSDERLPIASVTKVMTMLLIMEAVDSGKISLDDMVTVSENAMSTAEVQCFWKQENSKVWKH